MLTVEDTNSIIEHFGKAVSDYYVLDTRLLDTTDYWFAYDFIIISKSSNSITFEISNTLWTGGYYIYDCNITDYNVNIYEKTITISGTGLEYVVLGLELSTNYFLSTITELAYNPYFTPVIRPFYEDVTISPIWVDKTDTPKANLAVTTEEGVKNTNSQGEVSVNYSSNSSGLHTSEMSISQNNLTETYDFPFIRVKSELPIILVNNEILKDKKQVLTFKFLFDDNYQITDEMLFTDNKIRLIVNNKIYEITEYADACFSFFVNLEDYFYDNIELKLNINGNDYIETYSTTIKHEVVFETLDNVSDLKLAIEDENGADTIYYEGTDIDDLIYVNRDVRIEFSTPIINSIPDSCFIVDNNAELILNALDYTGNAGLTILNSGQIQLLNSNIYDVTDTIITGGDAILKNSVFTNNVSVCDCKNVDLYNSSFILSDATMLKDDILAFVKVAESCIIDYCKFDLKLNDVESIPYVFINLGVNSTVNITLASNLMVNESFPVRKCTSELEVTTSRAIFTGKSNKCFIWTVENTNKVYSNKLEVEYV